VAAQLDDERVGIFEQTGPEAWANLAVFEQARFPNLALDSEGNIHLAWFSAPAGNGEDTREDELLYANETNAFQTRTIASGIHDRSPFWDTAETDGSFAFAIDHRDRPSFVWETDSEQRRFGRLTPDGVVTEETELKPSHGNIQTTMRMGFDDAGRAHVASGYGGLGLYRIRTPGEGWDVYEVDRRDVFDLAVADNGRAAIVGGQPHGGTTLSVLSQTETEITPADPSAEDAQSSGEGTGDGSGTAFLWMQAAMLAGAGLGTGLGLIAMAGLGVKLVDRYPSWFSGPRAWIANYTRLDRQDLLDDPTRQAILEAARSDPGVEATSVRETVDVARSTFFYHVHKLEREDLLDVERSRGRLFLSAPGVRPPDAAPQLTEGERELVAAVTESPGQSATAYADAVNASPRTVRDRLKRLERHGHLECERVDAHTHRWRPAKARGT
jgi:DNA-binding MarR family transcriptional regulator